MTDNPARSRTPLMIGALVVAAGIGAAALYGTAGGSGNTSVAACQAASQKAAAIQPLVKGHIAAFAPATNSKPLPNLTFAKADGTPMSLSDFKGRTVLFNLWATWCAPCREEMPALDRLQAELGSDTFEVVAVNIDVRNFERPKTWLAENKIERLAYYSDGKAKVFQDLKGVGKAFGMPTTLLVDGSGCEIGILNGPADWASEEAKAMVRAALGS